MSRLGVYLQAELHRHNLSPEEFGARSGLGTSHVYQIIRGQKENVRQATVARIATGLGMTPGELLIAVEAQGSDDPIEQAIRQRTAEMREAVRDTPQEFWATIIRKTFDRAIDGARDMATMLTEASSPRSTDNVSPGPPDNAPRPITNGPESESDDSLRACQPVFASAA